MRLIAKPQGGGKTKDIISWAREDSRRLILVASDSHKDEILGKAPELKNRIVTPFILKSTAYQGMKYGFKEIGVDDLEHVLYALTELIPGAISITVRKYNN